MEKIVKNKEKEIWEKKRKKDKRKIIFLLIGLLLLYISSFNFGRYQDISLIDSIKIILSKVLPIEKNWMDNYEKIVLFVRFPRITAALIIGAALALAGASYQTVFKNPLVSPDILGASAGASLGAAIAIFLGFGSPWIQIFAFFVSIVSVFVAYIVSSRVKKDPVLALVLSGMFIASFANALVSLIKFVADPNDKLPAITYWLMGSLANIRIEDIKWAIIPIILGSLPLILFSWKLNVLSLGDSEAKSLGVETKKLRVIVIICSTVITSVSISIGGLISWVGLIIPHLMRMFVSSDNKVLLPASAIAGGGFLLLADNIARSITNTEIPLGVLTAIIGAPFFIVLITRQKGR